MQCAKMCIDMLIGDNPTTDLQNRACQYSSYHVGDLENSHQVRRAILNENFKDKIHRVNNERPKDNSNEPGFFSRVFSSIKTFFSKIFDKFFGKKTNTEVEEIKAIVEKKLEEIIKKYNLPALQVSLSSAKGKITASSGLQNLQTKKPVDDNSKFQANSITKTFTAVMILQLVQEGRLSLDETIDKLLPDLAQDIKNSNQITVAHLLKHSSGIDDHNCDDDIAKILIYADKAPSVTENIKMRSGKTNICKVGEKYNYSNIGYDILGLILEKMHKKNLTKILQDQITNKLNMRNTSLGCSRDDEKFTSGYSTLKDISFTDAQDANHFKSKLGPTSNGLTDTSRFSDELGASGSGGIVTTTEDLSSFVHALYDTEKLLSQPYKDLMIGDTINIDDQASYGYGVYLAPSPIGQRNFHTGDDWGYSSSYSYFAEQGSSIAVFSNRAMDSQAGEPSLLHLIEDELFSDTKVYDFIFK